MRERVCVCVCLCVCVCACVSVCVSVSLAACLPACCVIHNNCLIVKACPKATLLCLHIAACCLYLLYTLPLTAMALLVCFVLVGWSSGQTCCSKVLVTCGPAAWFVCTVHDSAKNPMQCRNSPFGLSWKQCTALRTTGCS